MKRTFLFLAAIILLVLTFAPTAGGQKPYGIAEQRQVTFAAPVWVGGVLLPAGGYTVRHTMEGADHVMLFTAVRGKPPLEARAKCELVATERPLHENRAGFRLNRAGEQVLTLLAFKGDSAEHRF